MTVPANIQFDNSYARLPERFYSRQSPTPVAEPSLIAINEPLAQALGIDRDWLASPDGLSVLAGNGIAEGSDPIATAYAGHQFGGWNPQLGDGRAVLLGEVMGVDQRRFDLQLKGSGPTPWSRGGDGRSPIGPVLREYCVSEAMAVLGVPTTRALAAVTTGERVIRDEAQPGAILARVASSHIRIGTFQYFAARKDTEALQLLVEQVIARHYPLAAQTDNPCLSMLHGVIAAQATLIAHWQLLGFIHGVMNTDNMLLSGETVDYGPCAFMDGFHPETVFSSIDTGGRYAYRNQPGIAHWNLANLAQTLLPVLHEDEEEAVRLAQTSVDTFPELFLQAHEAGMNRKLGLSEPQEDDASLVEDLLDLMAEEKADFTLTFRRLADLADPQGEQPNVSALYEFSTPLLSWLDRWQARTQADAMTPAERQASMYQANPVFIPRNHLVEETIQAALYEQDLEPFHKLNAVLSRPCSFDPALTRYATPPQPQQVVSQTFCGT